MTDGTKPYYSTQFGKCYNALIEEAIRSNDFRRLRGKINLILTSPPFPLKRKKKYGNFSGNDYIGWLSGLGRLFKEFLTRDGSIVIELGNAWVQSQPIMSTVPLKALIRFQEDNDLYLCQQFIWFNTARLPGPAEWVNIERIRVKDAFTTIWWLSKIPFPRANNRKVLTEYSSSMKRLLRTKKYNSGVRPSEHVINPTSFLNRHKGAIPPNVFVASNTSAQRKYILYCKQRGLPVHPARMPDFIVDFFVRFLTRPGDIVFDPFAGSNTTGAVSEVLKRKWISVEAEKDYVRGSKGRFNLLG